jgi:hypothetical protein
MEQKCGDFMRESDLILEEFELNIFPLEIGTILWAGRFQIRSLLAVNNTKDITKDM